ncbi:hypothetical protein D3C74_382210 [compost metagenome]
MRLAGVAGIASLPDHIACFDRIAFLYGDRALLQMGQKAVFPAVVNDHHIAGGLFFIHDANRRIVGNVVYDSGNDSVSGGSDILPKRIVALIVQRISFV